MTSRAKPETAVQAAIVSALNSAGWHVWRINSGSTRVRRGYLHGAPKGAPDLYVVGWGWLEIKTGRGALTEDQLAMHDLLRNHGELVSVVRSPAEALRAVMGGKVRGTLEVDGG